MSSWPGVLLDVALLVAAALLALPVLVLAFEVASAGRAPQPVPRSSAPAHRGRLTVLMPAHDEAAGIAASVVPVLAQLGEGDRIVVIADNCRDRTAELARAAGAEVVERLDPLHRGKGYALDFGVRHLAADPPETVIVIDADCIVGPGALDTLTRRASSTGRPVQARYVMRAPKNAPLKSRIAEFAWVFKNEVRAVGLHRLGLPCQLAGSGMAFPWSVIRDAPLASAHLVEDLQLGLELALSGTPPLLCSEATVTSVFPTALTGFETQRRRWEQGHLAVIAAMGPRVMWRGLIQRRRDLVAMALDLCVPPLGTLVVSLVALGLAAAAWAIAGGPIMACVIDAATLAMLVLVVLAAWRRWGRDIVSWRELASVPIYVAAKLPMYARMALQRQTEWVRTRRDEGDR